MFCSDGMRHTRSTNWPTDKPRRNSAGTDWITTEMGLSNSATFLYSRPDMGVLKGRPVMKFDSISTETVESDSQIL